MSQTSSALQDGAGGAALGTAVMPGIGTAIGAAGGAALGWLTGGDGGAAAAAAAAQAQHVAQEKQNAIALENYRQASRDQYHSLLTAQAAPYQGYSNWLKAATGSGLSTAGLAANENPLTLQMTGIGAPQGSNYTGYDTNVGHHNLGNGQSDNRATYHVGIGTQIGDPSSVDPDGASSVNGAKSVGNDGTKFVSTVDPNSDVAQYLNPANNSTYSPASVQAPTPTPNSSAGFQFAPRRA
jgi:hypothetical protein